MREIMISIQPQWVEKILNGEKTIEIRKTMPKCELPCKVYIYCTQGKMLHDMKNEEYWTGKRFAYGSGKSNNIIWSATPFVNGKVVAEFTLNEVDTLWQNNRDKTATACVINVDVFEKQTCMTWEQYREYHKCKNGKYPNSYAWHIDDLKIYDKPKELSEFKTPHCDKPESACRNCKYLEVINTPNAYECNCYVENGKPFKRPPQSWCYCEVLNDSMDN